MNPSKLKNLLILLFLAVNLFFLYKLTDLIEQKNNFRDDYITEAVDILETKGVHIDSEDVIRQKSVPDTVRLDWNTSVIEQLAKKLMKHSYGSFSIPDGHSFTGDSESLSFLYDYSFEYRRFDSNVTVDEIKNKLESTESGDSAKALERLLEKLLSADRKFNAEINVTDYFEQNGATYLSAQQTINGNVAEGASFYAALNGDELSFMYGRFYPCHDSKKYVTDYLDSINVLFELEPSEKKIDSMEIIYLPVTENNDCVYLVPAYKFTYSDGTTAFYDAASGVKRK